MQQDDHVTFMRRAIELSYLPLKNNQGNPFGAVVVKDGKIIGEGWNKSKVLIDPSSHAELEAIRDACKNLSTMNLQGCIVYASAQPCPMCLSLVYLTGISKVFYCIPGDVIEEMNPRLGVEHIYQELAKPQSQRTTPETRILQEEVQQIVERYKN